jgi:hypothetical protein
MNPKTKILFLGALIGAGFGVLGGYLYARSAAAGLEEAEGQEISLQGVAPGEMVRLVISMMGVLRSVAELGQRG